MTSENTHEFILVRGAGHGAATMLSKMHWLFLQIRGLIAVFSKGALFSFPSSVYFQPSAIALCQCYSIVIPTFMLVERASFVDLDLRPLHFYALL